jgi:hypothetical protein
LLFDNGGLIDCDLVSCNLVSLDADRSDLIGDNNGNTLDGGFIECDDNNSKSDENSSDNNVEDGDDRILIAFGVRSNSKLYDTDGILSVRCDDIFPSELITRSVDGGDLILLAVRCDNTLYDNNFNSEDGTNTLGNNGAGDEGLSRSFDGGGILILFAVRCNKMLYGNIFDSEYDVNPLDNKGLSRSKFAS